MSAGAFPGDDHTLACKKPRRFSAWLAVSKSRDLSRHQLMNQRTIFGFEPSAESYAPAMATLEVLRAALAAQNVTRQADVDLCVAVIGGLIDAQLANDPGGDRWSRLLDRAIDMLADNLGVPAQA
jgi:hypothetical protein